MLGLQTSRDRLGSLLYSAASGAISRWMEVDFQGKLLGIWDIGEHVHLALTANSGLYTFGPMTPGDQPTLLRFDRKSSSWQEVEGEF